MDFLSAKTDSALARALPVNRQTLAGWRKRDSVPYVECIKFCEDHGLRLDWLLTGLGPMHRGDPLAEGSIIDTAPDDQILLELLRELDEGDKKELRLVARQRKRLSTLENRLQELESVVAGIIKPS
ncbi:hypothetical protein RU08_10000 [Pseudomonas fulva]|uniref:Bacteriophage CI repressor N-terminal domain-containing protein n=2 Tax=Pseudomonas TaxID=286 RepID=A0A0D0KUV2_9PSED|nr:hypothetical protein RU08_10000 [Pseudomonas fulva]